MFYVEDTQVNFIARSLVEETKLERTRQEAMSVLCALSLATLLPYLIYIPISTESKGKRHLMKASST